MDNEQTGNIIRELRLENEMTQKDLADILNVTEQAV
ncbi:MAG: helix-turn-helix transcriptional regulator [Spirochaetales bacterium]|nr:helix-turn-helix transcriptional regulator [Spirochaetales bacterium]